MTNAVKFVINNQTIYIDSISFKIVPLGSHAVNKTVFTLSMELKNWNLLQRVS